MTEGAQAEFRCERLDAVETAAALVGALCFFRARLPNMLKTLSPDDDELRVKMDSRPLPTDSDGFVPFSASFLAFLSPTRSLT